MEETPLQLGTQQLSFCTAGIVNWTDELSSMDRHTRKLLTMHGAKANVDRFYIPRREGGRGLLSVESSVQQEVHSLSQYVHESEEELLKCVVNEGVMKRWNDKTSEVMKQEKKRQR